MIEMPFYTLQKQIFAFKGKAPSTEEKISDAEATKLAKNLTDNFELKNKITIWMQKENGSEEKGKNNFVIFALICNQFDNIHRFASDWINLFLKTGRTFTNLFSCKVYEGETEYDLPDRQTYSKSYRFVQIQMNELKAKWNEK